ncbi:hypothetical protein [Streptomyces sp. CA-111067]|uniref:hypothetical protein n=1 Tax=Streptomyces sp. CA-111067 TaxID=3240046 RepID=UPI003D96D085
MAPATGDAAGQEPRPEDAEQPAYWPTEHREPAPTSAQHNATVQAARAEREGRR